MTYLPGTDEAIYPGTEHISAEAVIEDDRHLVVLDLSPTAYPLDGLIPTLARTLADVGALDAFCRLGRVRSSHPAVLDALAALAAEPSIARVLQITLTPEDAGRLRDELDDASVEPEKCRYRSCGYYRIETDYCARHVVDDYDRGTA